MTWMPGMVCPKCGHDNFKSEKEYNSHMHTHGEVGYHVDCAYCGGTGLTAWYKPCPYCEGGGVKSWYDRY